MGGGKGNYIVSEITHCYERDSEGGGEVVETLAVSQNNLLPATALAS